MEYIALYFLILSIVGSSFLVILARNPVVSMLYLVLVFLQSSVIFLLLGAEFLFILFLIVYVGAVAILFLFVIMLLNLRVVESYNTFYHYTPIGLFMGMYFFFLALLLLYIDSSTSGFYDFSSSTHNLWGSSLFFKSNVISLGELLYNYHGHFFLVAGLILFVALLGVISLTLAVVPKARALYDHRRVAQNSFFMLK